MQLYFGIDTLLQHAHMYKNLRTGFVTNNAATTVDGRQSRVALLQNGFNITKLFSPEHGLNATGADGLFQQNTFDTITGLPVISLYGESLSPTETDLTDIDILIFDLPDVGCRFYTYQWTLTYIMEACAAYKKPLIICDRPNPLSGNFRLAEGPMLDDDCASFIGRWNIPLRHSCTIAELALYWNKSRNLNVDLSIMPLQNWNRNHFFTDLNIPFIPTSPGIPNAETALLYPVTGLLEGINVSEGRGTKTPFKICGAPWIDAPQLSNAFNALQLPGVKARPYYFTPTSGKYANEICNGLLFTVEDAAMFRPITMGFFLLHLLFQLYPDKAAPDLYPTNANPTGSGHLEKLTGYRDIWNLLKMDTISFRSLTDKITKVDEWKNEISQFLLYS